MKCNQPRQRFELVSPCPFPSTITITPWAPQVFLSNTNNLHTVVCFQVFLSNTNILHTVLWFQVFQPNIDNLHTVVWFQVFLFNINNLHTVVRFQVFLSNTNNSPKIYFTERTKTGTSFPEQNRHGSNGNEGIHHTPEDSVTGASPSDTIYWIEDTSFLWRSRGLFFSPQRI